MDKEVYGRAIILKNCGRFLNIASDFGSEYKTHPFLTEQMVYAGLTRENELIGKRELQLEKGQVPDDYDFNGRYRIPNGRYFTCAYIIDKKDYKNEGNIKLWNKNRDNSDINDFNSIQEDTGKTAQNNLPTYGNIEWMLPNNYFITFAISTDKDYFEKYYKGQTFYMGKKRTMFQIEEMSEVVVGQSKQSEAELFLPIQLSHQEVENFNYYEILTLTQRYILLKGKTKEINNYQWQLEFKDLTTINLPNFFVDGYLGMEDC
ncbi:hypothetical protein MWH25_01555 [Natroniella acetigena]|uniref:hypothetical protein n=1 Tax=Natroniella acetigena TaxID=52004 RepID=UPI00200A09AA|nr:hypothetical protein [Natroniella acetigena]MCK8826434.1 hypothetical protein [Natroniella acetigena]